MKGYAFPGGREVAVVERPTPSPGPGEVLIKSGTSSVCGSDLHGYRAPKQDRAPFAAVVSGHEPVGEVVAVGDGVAWPTVGERVVVYHVGGCGECGSCHERDYKACPGATEPDNSMTFGRDGSNADHVLVPAGQVLPLPEDFSYPEGSVLSCNFGTAWGAVRNAFSFPGGTLAVWGLGPVGLNCVLIARALGMKVIGVDISEGRREVAEGVGATVVDGARSDVVEAVRSVTGGDGPDAIIDTTGVGAVHAILVSAVKPRGTVVLVGLGHETSVGPVPEVVLKQVTIKGSWLYDVADWPEMLDFVRQHEIDLMTTVDKVVPIAEFETMLKEADAASAGKIVFTW
ncbi:zinc-binding dehydrogenase [Saccharopolyspora sp. TS4A08]|uniref:Zinc-binding dehydrogenase n=1 Tax=Saccharopolyspora ipomoeae TaxID=3042027 RepID=A0ABT6PQ99_9PSEU|nr:zinc-binding dehydrogenase [Saccharopolyspora sp. TS4A08]MDI2030177.1 zinc-binding dehydrogenase [Saccharopolyspora sp. TS4A08]